MKLHRIAAVAVAFAAGLAGAAFAAEKDVGFDAVFDGKTLKGWDGDPRFWRVEDGAITGQTTKDNPTKGNTFIIWTGGKLADFELRLEYRIIGGNSGIQYRSFKAKGADKWRIGGYQADFEAGDRYSGILYGERFRGILADRGQKTELTRDGKKFAKKVVGSVGDSKEIGKAIKKEEWNDYHIIARGYHFIHKINGVTTCECTDNDKAQRRAEGLLALQLHAGPPMKVQFRNIRVKHYEGKKTSAVRPKDAIDVHVSVNELRVQGKLVTENQFADRVSALVRDRKRPVLLHTDPGLSKSRWATVVQLLKPFSSLNVISTQGTELARNSKGQRLESPTQRHPDGLAILAKGIQLHLTPAKPGEEPLGSGLGVAAGFGVTAQAPAKEPKPAAVPKKLGKPSVLKIGGRGVTIDLERNGLKVNVKGLKIDVAGEKTKEKLRGTLQIQKDGKSIVSVNLAKARGVSEKKKKVVLIAGRRSHGYGSHEHKAGCMLLAKALNESGLPIAASVVTDGWPKDESVLDSADAIVIYCDGGGGHPFNRHLDKIDALMKKGVGLTCIHYAVEVPKGKSGEAFLDWTGGYFEAHWSVNPHWTADYKKLPAHPIANGVKPFSINDEWYYHMRFREKMAGVTPILTDLPPKSTLRRGDGAHSGNKFVREAVAKGIPQHMAWATERKDGGRGFGITGGHNHWNWGHDQFRKLVLNAIVWTVKLEDGVPAKGVPSKSLTVEDLMANQDYDPPANFNPNRIKTMLRQWNGSAPKKTAAPAKPTSDKAPTLDEVRKQVAAGKAVLIDVREEREWKAGHFKQAKFLPLSKIANPKFDPKQHGDVLTKDKPCYLHCRRGGRAVIAAGELKRHGYDARPLRVSFEKLAESGFETTK